MSTVEHYREPSVESPHREFWEHLKNGGLLFRDDRLNRIRGWITIGALGGNASRITRFGYTNLTIVPADASDYTDNGFTVVFYRRNKAFGMNVLDYWCGKRWNAAGTLPWNDLKPVPKIESEIPAPCDGYWPLAN